MEEALYWLVGAVGVPLVQWLKKLAGAQGKSAVWLTVAVAVILSIAALFLGQELALTDFTLANLAAVFGQVLAAATLAYKLLLPDVS
jgi:Tfp pilus assembly protein PilN